MDLGSLTGLRQVIDQNHLLSSLYNMFNVPQAVWIDERGKIVRQVETGGSLDIAHDYDQETRARAKLTCINAVGDWAANGSAASSCLTLMKLRSVYRR